MSNGPTHPYNGEYLFSWDDIPAIASECERLLEYLSDKFGIYWAKPGDIDKSSEVTISISKGVNSVEITLDGVKEKATKATLKISGNDETYDLKVKRENGMLKVYDKQNGKSVRRVWFYRLLGIVAVAELYLICSMCSGHLLGITDLDLFNTSAIIPVYVPVFGFAGGLVHFTLHSARRYEKGELTHKLLGLFAARAMVSPLLAIALFCLISLVCPTAQSVELIAGLCFIVGLYVRMALQLLWDIGTRLFPLNNENGGGK